MVDLKGKTIDIRGITDVHIAGKMVSKLEGKAVKVVSLVRDGSDDRRAWHVEPVDGSSQGDFVYERFLLRCLQQSGLRNVRVLLTGGG